MEKHALQSGKTNYFSIVIKIYNLYSWKYSFVELQEKGLAIFINGATLSFQWNEIPYAALQKLDCQIKEATDRNTQPW